MSITKFQFIDRSRDWTLEETSFSNFNLLVGLSGVGKTRILDTLRVVRHAGIFDTRHVNGCQWTMELEHQGTTFFWKAKTSLLGTDEDHLPHFIEERIVRDDNVVLVERTKDEFRVNGKPLGVKLKNTESAITLLHQEESIAPLHWVLRHIVFGTPSHLQNVVPIEPPELKYQDIDALREAPISHIWAQAYILQEDFPEEFQKIKDDFLSIFETITDIKFAELSTFDPFAVQRRSTYTTDGLAVGIKERGVNGWITSETSGISSGIRRTLTHLIELALAPTGSVIALDDIENSLGVNCLDEVVKRMLMRTHDVQFILTSHHPYVINNVPSKFWKIVTRKGSTVTVVDEASVPALQTASRHAKFLLLMNLPEYEEGIQ